MKIRHTFTQHCRALLGILSVLFLTWSVRAAEPANAGELAKKKSETDARVAAADARRKAAMTPEEAAWEKTLEENLGAFYLPLYKNDKMRGAVTAWDYVKDDPKLPRVLLIGDSISRGYTLAVRRALAGKANVHRAPANCGPTAMGLKKLDVWLGEGRWDVIHFNFGIHDRNAKPEAYTGNLEQIVARLKKTGAGLIWASTTPMPQGSAQYPAGQSEKLNALAAPVMERNGIPIDDLYAAAIEPELARHQNTGDVHYKEPGYDLLGARAARSILAELERRTKTKP